MIDLLTGTNQRKKASGAATNFNVGHHPIHECLIEFLVQQGFPGVDSSCTVEKQKLSDFVKRHIKTRAHEGQQDIIYLLGRWCLSKAGWDEMMRIAKVEIVNRVVVIRKKWGAK